MTDENPGWKNLKGAKQYYSIAIAFASGVYGGNIINIFFGFSYMQASALAGASIFPAIVGGIVGLTAYRIFFKFPSFSIVLAIALGAATYAIIGSFLIQPVNGVEAMLVSYGKPVQTFSCAFFAGIVSGIILAIFNKKKWLWIKGSKNSH
ncbi:MAG: hypothetical protein JJV89_04530 [Desulfosarcina sp.]|nr:hypothetical protein [Desulfobacterales bacterium]